jgi:hypothetical protein
MEVDAAVAAGEDRDLWFGPRQALERVDAIGDLFADVQTLEQTLPTA